MSSKLEPVIWLRVLVTLAYMKGWTYVRTVDDVMAIEPNFLTSMGYHIFLAMVLRARPGPQRRKRRYVINRLCTRAGALLYSLLNLRSVTVEISPTRVTRVVYPDNW